MDKAKLDAYFETREEIEVEANKLLQRYCDFLSDHDLESENRIKNRRRLEFHGVTSSHVQYEDYDGDIVLEIEIEYLYTEDWEPIELKRILDIIRAEQERIRRESALRNAEKNEQEERTLLARLKAKYEGESNG